MKESKKCLIAVLFLLIVLAICVGVYAHATREKIPDFTYYLQTADRAVIEYHWTMKGIQAELLRKEEETLFCGPLLSLTDALKACKPMKRDPGIAGAAIWKVTYYHGDTQLLTFDIMVGHPWGWRITYSIAGEEQSGKYLYDARLEKDEASTADYRLLHNPPEGIRNLIQSMYDIMQIDEMHILAVLGLSEE